MTTDTATVDDLCRMYEGVPAEEPHRKKEILLRIHNKDARLYRVYLAHWFIDDPSVWREVKITQTPYPPREMVEYYQLPREKQLRMTKDFWNLPDVAEYVDRKGKVIARNKNWYKLAHELLEWLPENDVLRREKVKNRIAEMQGMLEAGGLPVPEKKDVDPTEIDWED